MCVSVLVCVMVYTNRKNYDKEDYAETCPISEKWFHKKDGKKLRCINVVPLLPFASGWGCLFMAYHAPFVFSFSLIKNASTRSYSQGSTRLSTKRSVHRTPRSRRLSQTLRPLAIPNPAAWRRWSTWRLLREHDPLYHSQDIDFAYQPYE